MVGCKLESDLRLLALVGYAFELLVPLASMRVVLVAPPL